jgi:hypothetical protein
MLHTLDEGEPRLEEAYENLRLIREMMERSTKHSSLSGYAGLLVGLWAIVGVVLTRVFAFGNASTLPKDVHLWRMAAVWLAILVLSVLTDYLLNKRFAGSVGKHVFSSLGARLVQAASPGFVAGLVFTVFLLVTGSVSHVWGFWMLSYGLAICSVGLFSVRAVSFLGWAFVLAGAVTLLLPPFPGLWMMAVTFGGFHICYGLYTGISRGEW